MKIIILVLSARGLQTALKLTIGLSNVEIHGLAQRLTHSEVDVLFEDTTGHIRQIFLQKHAIVGICSSGILVRAIASLLNDKYAEPPVISVASDGSSIVPLVGSHHGANDLANSIANQLNGHAAITTASDIKLGISLDSPPVGWVIANPDSVKNVMVDLINGAPVAIDPDLDWLSNLPCRRDNNAAIRLTASINLISPGKHELIFHPKRTVVGVGSDRGCPPEEMIRLIDTTISESGLARQTIACIVSIDRKADEAAVHAVAKHLDIPARFLSADTINMIDKNIPNPSDIVQRETGVRGVAEGAALAASGATKLFIEKRKTARATCAIAISNGIINPETVGRARGSVSVIGVGPGTPLWRSPECVTLLERATDWVGYSMYLDLIQDLKNGQTEHRFQLGEEEVRVRHALELAGSGCDVALISSGDAGIYAMATLLYEVIALNPEKSGLSDSAHRVTITVTPGISAFQAAAARAGAPIGHDFCCISLSDLLTPWVTIKKRIISAAYGDFVVAFYNPRSARRVDQLEVAIAILRKYRPLNTPVILASNLGRTKEKVEIMTLSSFNPEMVDMLSIVLIGASTTKMFTTGDGQRFVFTPRGYSSKRKNLE
ncbi:MAG: hypothetical protein TECD_00777 [Hyphomicrobiaceae bacterium hypho_1]